MGQGLVWFASSHSMISMKIGNKNPHNLLEIRNKVLKTLVGEKFYFVKAGQIFSSSLIYVSISVKRTDNANWRSTDIEPASMHFSCSMQLCYLSSFLCLDNINISLWSHTHTIRSPLYVYTHALRGRKASHAHIGKPKVFHALRNPDEAFLIVKQAIRYVYHNLTLTSTCFTQAVRPSPNCCQVCLKKPWAQVY